MSNKDLAAAYFDAVWSDHYNPDKIRELTSPNLVFRYPMHGEFHGPDAVIAILDSFRESITELPHGGPIPAGSGRRLFFSGVSLLKFQEGKVIEDIGQEGALDGHLQLGAVIPNTPAS
jgi:hypothetical protein